MADTRIAYGARCTWWDSISKVGPDEASFLAGIPAYEAAGHPGYGDAVKWARGKCFSGPAEMEAAYRAALQSKDTQHD